VIEQDKFVELFFRAAQEFCQSGSVDVNGVHYAG
jgi:hypothetical protein